MNDIRKKNTSKLVNVILPLIMAMEYASAVIRNISFACNILSVLLIFLIYFYFSSENKVQLKDLAIFFLTGILMLFSQDIAYVSLSCVYILFSVRSCFSQKLLKRCLIVSVCCMTAITVAYFFGFNRQYDTEIYRPLLGRTVERMSFGFVHPNQFAIFLLMITVMVYMCSCRLRTYTLITVIDCCLFKCTQSRTMMYVTLFLYFALLAVRIIKPRELKSNYIIPVLFILFIICSFVLSLFFARTKLDVILTGRLALNKKYLDDGLSLFGNAAFNSKPFDNSYIHMFVTKGLIYFFAYCFIMCSNLYGSKFKWKNAVIMLVIFLEAFMEVIFLKFGFMIIIPMLCVYRADKTYDTSNNTLLLVWKKSEV